MTEQEAQLPIMVILDKKGYLIAAGAPEHINQEDVIKAAKAGCIIKTITLKEYGEANYKWLCSKPKQQ
jgi:hypothetical protein